MTKTRVMFSAVLALIVAGFLALGLTGCGSPGTYVTEVDGMKIYAEGVGYVGSDSDPNSVLVMTDDTNSSFLVQTEYQGTLSNDSFDSIMDSYSGKGTVTNSGSAMVLKETSISYGLYTTSYVIGHRTGSRGTDVYFVDIFGMDSNIPPLNFVFQKGSPQCGLSLLQV